MIQGSKGQKAVVLAKKCSNKEEDKEWLKACRDCTEHADVQK
jgi:hypothetical protein